MTEAHKVILADLADKLAAIGIRGTPRNIQHKIARGDFEAVFFLKAIQAIRAKNAQLTCD